MKMRDGDQLKGMITDRDITIRATAAGKDPNTTRVSETMTDEVVYVFDDQDVKDANNDKLSGQVLEQVSEPAHPKR